MSSDTTTVRVPYAAVLRLRSLRAPDATDADALAHIAAHTRTCDGIRTLGAMGKIDPSAPDDASLSLKERLTTKPVRVDRDTAERFKRYTASKSSTPNAIAHAIEHYRQCDRASDICPPGDDEAVRPAFRTNRIGDGKARPDSDKYAGFYR